MGALDHLVYIQLITFQREILIFKFINSTSREHQQRDKP